MSLKQFKNERNNIFVGEFEQQDKTRSIIYTSLQQTGGATAPSRDDYNHRKYIFC